MKEIDEFSENAVGDSDLQTYSPNRHFFTSSNVYPSRNFEGSLLGRSATDFKKNFTYG